MGGEARYEVVVTTQDDDGVAHLAPLAAVWQGDGPLARVVLQPWRPSRTLDHMLARGAAVLSATTDVRVFAGLVTGRRDWPLLPAQRVRGERLAFALSHAELTLLEVDDHAQRPRLTFEVTWQETHAAFPGFNRAQSAVLEAAMLVSRREHDADAVARELALLGDAVERCGGAPEREAWGWLLDAHAARRASLDGHDAAPPEDVDDRDDPDGGDDTGAAARARAEAHRRATADTEPFHPSGSPPAR